MSLEARLREFIAANCEYTDDHREQMPCDALRQRFRQANGPVTDAAFGRAVRAIGMRTVVGKVDFRSVRMVTGLRWKLTSALPASKVPEVVSASATKPLASTERSVTWMP